MLGWGLREGSGAVASPSFPLLCITPVGAGACAVASSHPPVQFGAGALEQNETCLIPASSRGAAQPSSPPPEGTDSPTLGTGTCGAACEGCCCAGGGCWPPATCWAAAGTAAARAGTTPAGLQVPTGLTATATPTARGRATAARTTRPRAAAPVSVGMGRAGQDRPLGSRLVGLVSGAARAGPRLAGDG